MPAALGLHWHVGIPLWSLPLLTHGLPLPLPMSQYLSSLLTRTPAILDPVLAQLQYGLIIILFLNKTTFTGTKTGTSTPLFFGGGKGQNPTQQMIISKTALF